MTSAKAIKRRERVQLLLSKEEKAVLVAYANRRGVSVTAALRLLLTEEIDGFGAKPAKR